MLYDIGREGYAIALGYRLSMLRIAEQQCVRLIQRQVGQDNTELVDKLTPHYELGCQRILMHNSYYSTLAKPNVTVQTSGIKSIGSSYIICNDNTTLSNVDIIIYATGFAFQRAETNSLCVYKGINNTDLSKQWSSNHSAYNGIIAHNFPNLFWVLGMSKQYIQY